MFVVVVVVIWVLSLSLLVLLAGIEFAPLEWAFGSEKWSQLSVING